MAQTITTDKQLTDWCLELADASVAANAWIDKNPEIVRNEKEGLQKELRRAGRLFRNCARAASRKMCAGVFGPSQAGKSYLISALARGPSNRLDAVFEGETHDFLSEINPEGGKESTGLVTRFTLSKPDTPKGYPVQLALLSETDIVKIIANTYYADCEHKEEAQSNIAATLESLRPLAIGQPGRIDLDSLEDLREYLQNDFRAKARVQELERSYWDEALALGPKLDLEGRIRLYALIWDEVEEFTNLLRQLLQALMKTGFSETLYCSMDALVPRDASIIDVATLNGLESPSDNSELKVCTPDGIKTTLPRSIVTALTAELTISMAEKPADYFEHTDLLDFPGYRSRYKLDDIRREVKKEGMLKELFLRGKVAYLFQRYSAQRELNSMLLCIGPSNQEVQDLPGVINAWIASTHGATPDERAGKKTSLFLILTKFDMEFEDKKGAPSLEGRWDNRLHASLLDFFGKQHDWPLKWTPDRGFDNIFLLRNPNFRFEAIMDFSGDTETGIRENRKEYVERLKKAFFGSALVRGHFRDPSRAWEEAMRLNDGGISYIREQISPVCDPAIKRDQLLKNVDSCRENILRRLSTFYQTDDREQLRAQKIRLIATLFKSLGKLESQRHRLGQLLGNFTISDAEIYDLYNTAVRRYRDKGREEENPADKKESFEEIDITDLDLSALNPFSDASAETTSENEQFDANDEASIYAELIESKWVEKLHKIADDPVLQKFFMLSPQEFSALASELATGAERLGIRKSLIESFHKIASYANTEKSGIARRQAVLAGKMLNEYVDWLGYNPQTKNAEERTIKISGPKEPIVFQPAQETSGLPVLDETPGQYTRKWFEDWLNALAGVILENVNFDGKQTINVAENAQLGKILKKMGNAA